MEIELTPEEQVLAEQIKKHYEELAVFTVIEDESHAWLSVSDPRFIDLARLVSSGYGYTKGNTIYLEEDAEMPAFIEQLKRLNVAYTLSELFISGQWRGRHYPRNTRNEDYWNEQN